MGARKGTDWEKLELDYCSTRLSLRELAAKHGSDASLISRRAKRLGWTRNLTDAVRRATRAAVIAETVQQRVDAQAAEATVRQADAVVNAELNKQVILRHRAEIADARAIAMDLIGELHRMTRNPEELIELARQAAEGMHPLAAQSLQDAAREAVKLTTRVASLHKLADTLAKLQALERKAFGLDDQGDDAPNACEDGRRALACR